MQQSHNNKLIFFLITFRTICKQNKIGAYGARKLFNKTPLYPIQGSLISRFSTPLTCTSAKIPQREDSLLKSCKKLAVPYSIVEEGIFSCMQGKLRICKDLMQVKRSSIFYQHACHKVCKKFIPLLNKNNSRETMWGRKIGK